MENALKCALRAGRVRIAPVVLLLLVTAVAAWAGTAPADFIVESRGGPNVANYSDVGSWGNSSGNVNAPGCTTGIGSRYHGCTTAANYGPTIHADWSYTPTVTGLYTVSMAWPSTSGQMATLVNIYTGDATGSTTPDQWGNTGGPTGIVWTGTVNMYYKNYGVWNTLTTVAMSSGVANNVGIYAGYMSPSSAETAAGASITRICAGAVKFAYAGPLKATTPTPADAATDVDVANPTLSWTTDGPTDTYDVYIGSSPTTLSMISSSQTGTTCNAGTLANGTVYYWRVDSTYGGKTTTGDVWSFTTVAAVGTHRLTLTPNDTAWGSCTGGGFWPAGPVTVTATPATNYHFVKWTTDAGGSATVSTSASFSYSMPDADSTLYAQFAADEHMVSVMPAPSAGGSPTVDDGASHSFGASVTVHANAPSDGYCFVNWSTGADGTGVVSRKPDYTFTMGAADVSFYANYAKAIFADGFEGLKTGAAQGKGTLDMNYVGGDNACDPGIGNGNPWWGTNPYNASAGKDPAYSNAGPHSGSTAAWSGYAGNGRNYVNLAYRCNNGNTYGEDPLYVDWWFYDPSGTGWDLTSGGYCDDSLSLVYAGAIPHDTDYPSNAASHNFDDSEISQRISLGMASDWCAVTGTAPSQVYTPYADFDHTKYQARIKAGAATDGKTAFSISGWYNLNITRSIGWHHGRIVMGAIDWGSYSNPVSFYLDDMTTPAMTGNMDSDINAIELVTEWKQGASNDTATVNWPDGTMYDDIVFGVPEDAPSSAPTAGAVGAVTTNSITWNWTQSGTVDGFHVFDATSGGSMKSGDLTTGTFAETGLAANTLCSRWVSAYFAPVKYAWWESARTPLTPTYTLAAVPVFGTIGDAAIDCNLGATKTDATVGQSAVFTAVNGFGTGADKASKYVYVWNGSADEPDWTGAAEWTTDDLTFTPSAIGTYYLHLQAVNGANVVNTTSASFGPYTFVPAGTPVEKISDLWTKTNGPAFILSNKSVSGVVDGAFWIEETNRSAAIKVVWSGSPIVIQDHGVDVTGVLDSSSGQRVLVAGSVTDKGALADENKIKPIVVVERAAGGKAVNADTPSISNGTGLYNIGMLVRIAGNVTSSDTGFFYLDDGSGLTDGSNTGIKVICGSVTAPTSGTKTVTGLVGIENGKPTLTIRGIGDIQ